MKNSDEAIDKVLAGLREAVPLEGLDSRVLAAVRKRVEAPRGLPLRWAAVGGFALAAVAAIALLAIPRSSTVPPAVQAIVQPQPLPPALPAPAAARPHRRTPAVRANAEVPAANAPTASFPAPPMPLTEQERLLIEVARHGAPKAVPVLDPDALARQETHAEQVFETVLATAQEPSIFTHKGDSR
jgi:hypothetical protein